MSNKEASKIYELIVESVINEVREDFENAGIDEQTLQDLRRNWQLRLSETKVSNFSWDDIPNNSNIDPTTNNGTILPTTDVSNQELNEFNIKQEQNNDSNNSTGLDQGLVLPGFDSGSVPAPPTQLSGENEESPVVKEEITDNQSTLPGSIPDDTNTTNSTNDHDNNIQQGEVTETPPIGTTNGQIELTLEDTDGTVEEQLRLQEKKAKRSALLDTDEVGSELDDSDDDYLISEGEDDGPDENLMLCLYDKVTRTKARWKCSLKDGVVTINHKDYTFQKAQVEAEWV